MVLTKPFRSTQAIVFGRRGFIIGATALPLAGASCPPASAADTPGVFAVDDYGADPTGVADSTAAVQAAVDAAAEHTAADASASAVVVLSAGTYAITTGIQIIGDARITVRGAGSSATTILLHAFQEHYFQIESSAQITITGVEVDRPDAQLPWTQLTVTSIDGYDASTPHGWVDVTVDDGYPSLENTMFDDAGALAMGFPLNPDGLLTTAYFATGTAQDAADASTWRTQNADGTWRLAYYNTSWNPFVVGQRIAFVAPIHQGIAFALRDVEGFALEDVTNRSSSYMGIWSSNISDVALDGYRAIPGPGRLLTSTRDAIHLTNSNRGSLMIENSTFSSSGDDTLFYATLTSGGVVSVTSDSAVTISRPEIVEPGDRVEVYANGSKALLGSTTVTSVSGSSIAFSDSIPGMTAGDIFYDLDAVFSSAVFRNNTVLNHRGRGLLPHGSNVLIEGNTFSDVPQAVLLNTVAKSSMEGPTANEVTIRDNTFENVFVRPAIVIGGTAPASPTTASASGYTIVGNTFLDVSTPVARVDLARDVSFEDNDVKVVGNTNIALVELGKDIRVVDGVSVSGTTATAATGESASVGAIVSVAPGVTNVSIADTTGDVDSPVFLNSSGVALTVDGETISTAIGHPVAPEAGRWSFAEGTGGWTQGKNIRLGHGDGVARYTTTGTDASILSPAGLAIDASTHPFLEMSIAPTSADGLLQVFFTTAAEPNWDDTKKLNTTVTADGTPLDLVLDMSQLSSWQGTITQLRIDPPGQSSGVGSGVIYGVALTGNATPDVSSRWDFAQTVPSEVVLYNMTGKTAGTDGTTYTSTGSARPLVRATGLGIDAASTSWLRIALRNGSAGTGINVFFGTDASPMLSESQKIAIPVAASDTAMRTYYVPVTHSAWTGTIETLRVDLPYISGEQATSTLGSVASLTSLGIESSW